MYSITMQSMFVISKVEYFLLASSIPFSPSLCLFNDLLSIICLTSSNTSAFSF